MAPMSSRAISKILKKQQKLWMKTGGYTLGTLDDGCQTDHLRLLTERNIFSNLLRCVCDSYEAPLGGKEGEEGKHS